jgi:hypothetical protein
MPANVGSRGHSLCGAGAPRSICQNAGAEQGADADFRHRVSRSAMEN